MRSSRRTLARRIAAGGMLITLVSLLLLPAVAFAWGSLLVSDYKVPKEADGSDSQSDGWYVIDENLLNDPYFSAVQLFGADGHNGLDWRGPGEVRARVVGRGYSDDKYCTPFTSFEDFAARSSEVDTGEDYLFRTVDDPSLRVWEGAQKTTLGGLEAYVNRSTVRLEYVDRHTEAEYGNTWIYWIPAGSDSGILVTALSAVSWSEDPGTTSGEHYGYQLDPITADVESILASLKFYPLDGTSAGTDVPGDTGGESSPWRTVLGGVAAVAAAAIAMAGAAASARAKKGEEEPPPDQPVGYVLQLSSARLTVSETNPATLTVTAFRVLPNRSYEPASEAAIVLHVPAGVAAQPPTAYGTLTTSVWQTDAIALGAAITIEATAALGGTSASVPVVTAGESRIVTRLQPAGVPLRTHGEHSLTLVATVELLGGDAEVVDPAAAQATITFAEDSEWLDISAPADYEGGRAVTVVASQPDPTSIVQPPESATIRVSAQVGERVITEVVTVELARMPEIDAQPDHVTLAADSGISTEVSVWITNSAGATWQFETEWREGSRLIAVPDIVSTGPATATLTITENARDTLDPTRPETSSTLVVVATADGFEPLRRQVTVIVTQEGLFVDRTNVDPSTGAFNLKADGSATPADIDLRVFVRDPATGEIAPDIGLAQQALLEIGGEEGTPGYAGLKSGGLVITPAGVRVLNVPSATFAVAIERKLPTGGEVLPATLLASVPGRDEPAFSALVPLRLLGVNTEPFSDMWQIELDRCRDTIYQYVPFEYQERLYTLVNERSLTMGAEGLYKMRRQIGDFAETQLLQKAHEYMDTGWWIQQIEDTLDWVSWCGDIAFGVASGTYLGVVGSIAISMLKPMLVSAMETWLAGGSLEDWLVSQTSMFSGTAEGLLTDPDVLSKLSGEKKAIGWALFIAYYFAKELYNDPKMSVTNAIKNVGKQLRDEGLIMFLSHIAHLKAVRGTGGAPGPNKPAAKPGAPDPGTTPKKPGASDGPAKKPAAADAPDAPKQPDADTKKQPDAPEKAPDAPEKQPDTPEKPTPHTRKGTPKSRADAMAAEIAAATEGGKPVDIATTERIMGDPDAMRKLKADHPEAWAKLHETRAKIYESHDQKLKEWIKKNVPEAEGKKIDVRTFGTPDGIDRDYRAGYVTVDPETNCERFIEFKKEKWAGKSAEIFAGETGGPTDPAGAKKWAVDRQQIATDMHHGEASVDMADQAMIYNKKTRTWEKTQITPNADLVMLGRSTLLDPDGYGKTLETKIAAAYHEGNHLDAFKQADKAVTYLEKVRRGYGDQQYEIKKLPPKINAGMQVIKDVQTGKLTPAEADARLKDLKYDGGLPDFMEKVSGQFAGLKWARKA